MGMKIDVGNDSTDDMGGNIVYVVDDSRFSTDEPEPTLAAVLAKAGVSVATFFLVSHDGVEYRDPDGVVRIHPGSRFKTEKRENAKPGVIHYEVNGEKRWTERTPLTVEEILRMAGAGASIDVTQLDSYFLESIADGRKYENLADRVAVKEEDRFLAVHTGRTPVA